MQKVARDLGLNLLAELKLVSTSFFGMSILQNRRCGKYRFR